MESPSIEKKKRLAVLTVPLDLVEEDELEACISSLLADGDRHQIVLMSAWDFVAARGNSAHSIALRTSSLVLTSSKLVVWAARFLRRGDIPRYMPFDFVIRILTILEKKDRSVYLIGGRPDYLQVAASNLRGSFPKLRIVGRCAGYFPQEHEENILLAIKKAAPTLLLAGRGLPGKEQWLLDHRKHLSPGLAMWCGECLEVFSGVKKKMSRRLWSKGLDFLPTLLKKPWRLLRAFVYFWFLILLIVYRIRGL
ncbi:MAG: WecB/TagA/CpsF family glycosyltransferase [Spirochaetales bacterium]|nr:WecB/TagA/CpsF family glycosyltransferase [Spirochaetales bacterium]